MAVGIDKFEKHFSTPIGRAMILLKKRKDFHPFIAHLDFQPHHLFLVLVERFFVEDNQFGSYFDMDQIKKMYGNFQGFPSHIIVHCLGWSYPLFEQPSNKVFADSKGGSFLGAFHRRNSNSSS